MADITVGYYNAVVNWDASGVDYTRITQALPADGDGILTSVKFVVHSTGITGLIVGMFYLVSGTTYKNRASATLGNFASGAREVTGLSIEVKTGDFIGYYHGGSTGLLRGRSGLGSGYKSGYVAGNKIGEEASYTIISGYAMSLSAAGETSAAGSKAFMHYYKNLMAGGVGRQC